MVFRLRIFIKTEIRDRKGRIVKVQEFESKSFLLNYAKLLGALFDHRSETVVRYDGGAYDVYGGIPYTSWTDTTYGQVESIECYYKVNAPDNDDSYGILVGRGTTPISVEDYALADKIAHGVGAGLFDYEPCSVSAISYETYPAPGWSRIIISRSFINLSGASIDVNEIGLGLHYYAKAISAGPTTRYSKEAKFLLLRDLLPAPDTVPDGYTYSVSYEIRWSA